MEIITCDNKCSNNNNIKYNDKEVRDSFFLQQQ